MTELTPLQNLWLTETVRLREEHAGPLEDLEANRLARSAGGDLPTRIQRRAVWLAERDGLSDALKHWLQGARLALIVMAVLAIVSGAGLAFAALGDGQTPVNVFWALGSLLGLNLILLLSWALGLVFAGEHGASLTTGKGQGVGAHEAQSRSNHCPRRFGRGFRCCKKYMIWQG